jgi:succinate dehydrogenase / fumarate reductase cytochrome b subunit
MRSLHENRPLSPHLGIYRWQISNTLSILHRITGVGLTVGLIPFALWIYSAAYAPELFACITDAFSTVLGKLFLLGWTVAFYYHLANGIRHLNWDIGRGFKLPEMAASGWTVVLFTVVLTILTWLYVANETGFVHV